MPIPRNWTEELALEWLSLRGYLTEVGIPVATGGRGGRMEADIVGAKAMNQTLEICHVEIGSLVRDYDRNIKTLKEKFSAKRTDSIRERFAKRLGVFEKVDYDRVYIDTWASRTKAQNLGSHGEINEAHIKIWTMDDLYREILNAIDEWRSAPGYQVKSRLMVTLPESYWMLKLLDHLRSSKLLAAIPSP